MSEPVLIHAPYGRDAVLICQVLERSGIAARCCRTVEELCSGLGESTGAVLISDESLTPTNVLFLAAMIKKQPPWSDLPLLVTTTGGEATVGSRKRLAILDPLGNISLLERPLRTVTLVSMVETALRARRRQYQLRENFAERERLLQELKRSNDELTQFAHIASHDLQAPVRLVKSFSELLARRYHGRLDESADKYIDTIQEGATTMEALVRTLLNYAIVGQEPITPEEVGLLSVVDSVVVTLQPSIEELRAEISYADLPAVQGDRVQLGQLMQNLVGNALKYGHDGAPPYVHIAAESADTEWKISVRDKGPGIAPEYHERIFLPLKRLHGREISGTGMGLAVCRKIVERHGGRIWVESEIGKGASFCFTLPVSQDKRDAAEALLSA